MADVCVLKMSAAPRSAVCQCRLRLQIGGGGAGLRGARADPAARAAFPLQSEPDLSCHNEQGGREASRRDAEQLANRRRALDGLGPNTKTARVVPVRANFLPRPTQYTTPSASHGPKSSKTSPW